MYAIFGIIAKNFFVTLWFKIAWFIQVWKVLYLFSVRIYICINRTFWFITTTKKDFKRHGLFNVLNQMDVDVLF